MDQIINYLLLTIIFVFDPLAIALVVAANFAFDQIRPKIRENLYGEKVKIKEKPIVEITEEDLEEDLKHGQEDIDEERMNIIGQNGNDGLHYEEEAGLPKGYTTPNPKTTPAEEQAEIEKIIKRPLMAHEIQQLKTSKLTKTFNDDNDDLKIHY